MKIHTEYETDGIYVVYVDGKKAAVIIKREEDYDDSFHKFIDWLDDTAESTHE